MRPYDPNSVLISLHIPKTGGSSLLQVLEEWFPNGRLHRHYPSASQKMPTGPAHAGGTCVHGHFNAARGHGVNVYYPGEQQFITFVRDPFERFVSNWFYMNLAKRTGAAVPMLDGDPSFETFLRARAEEQESNRNPVSMHWQLPNPHEVHRIGDIIDEQFVFVGVTERFQTSLNALASRIGKPVATAGHLNVSKRAEDFSSWRPFYEKHFKVEFDIYDAALKRNDELLLENR